jgi:hypothetical protein
MEMSISQHQLRRPQRPLRPDPFAPLANATDIFNVTSNNSTSSEPYETTSVSGQALCFGWLLLVLLCMCRPNVPDARYRRYPENRDRRRVSVVEDPQVREERIEQSLAVKRVVKADAEGGLTLGEPLITEETDSNTPDDTSASCHSMEENEETSTCIICLEPFRVGDIVAWSKQSTIPRDKADVEAQPCLHVFHRDCIASWLTNPKHDDCPACRSIILQESPDASSQADPEESSLEDEDLEAPSMMPFVIMHGLVSRMRHARYSLIGQSIDVSAADYAEDADDDEQLSCVPQPSQQQRVFSFGERRPSISKSERLRRGSVTSAGSHRDDRRTPPPPPVSLAESLDKPIALRRVVSAGPGSPARSIHHNEGPPLTDADDGAVFRPSLSPALRRTSSGIHARLSLSEDSIEEDLRIVRSSVSRRDVDQSTSDHATSDHATSDHAMEDAIIIEDV